MIRRIAIVAASLTLPLSADFTYSETSRMTGGALVQMSRMLGGMSKSMREITEPHTSTIYVQGDRMARLDARTGQIWDLSKETITDIDFEKRTYSTITLQQMKEAMERMMQRAGGRQEQRDSKKASDIEMDFKIDVKETGKVKQIAGMNAREVLLIMKMTAKDKKSGDSAPMTDVLNSIWVVDSVPGHQELQDFHMKMARKMASTFALSPMARSMGIMAASNPGMVESARKMAKEAEKLNGVHVMQIMKMGAGLDPEKASEVSDPASTPQGPKVGEAAGNAAGKQAERQALGGLGRALPGGLGGLGGLGRRRNREPEQPKQPEQPAQPAQPQSGVLMEMVSESSNFSTASISGDKFQLPAGFQQVEHPMLKAGR